MPSRFGLGPVFAFELLTTSRRWQVYASRAFLVASLVVALAVVWAANLSGRPVTTRTMASAGQSFYLAIVGTQLVLVLLAAPAASAGAICLEKARGTLPNILITDLADAEIVLGKLLAHICPLVGLLSCALPVMALGTLLGGIDPWALTGASLISLGTACFACSLALTLSVWGRNTPDVLFATYTFLLGWVLVAPTVLWLRWILGITWPLPEWFVALNPFWLAFAPYFRPGATNWIDVAIFLVAMLILSSTLIGVAVLNLRRVALRQQTEPPESRPWALIAFAKRWTEFLPGPPLDGNPVLWREWHRSRPSGWTRVLWRLHVLVAIASLIWILRDTLSANGNLQRDALFPTVLIGEGVAFGLLLLSATAPSSLYEERARRSLDVLMATPLSTFAIYWGKWWGAFRLGLVIASPVAIAAVLLALRSGLLVLPLLEVALVLAYAAAITSLGIALATWNPRPTRAVATCVAVYTVVTVGWVIVVVMMTIQLSGAFDAGLAAGSPFVGALLPLTEMNNTIDDSYRRKEAIIWIVFWIAFYGLISLALITLTLATFDHSLGRLSTIVPATRAARPSVEESSAADAPGASGAQPDCSLASP